MRRVGPWLSAFLVVAAIAIVSFGLAIRNILIAGEREVVVQETHAPHQLADRFTDLLARALAAVRTIELTGLPPTRPAADAWLRDRITAYHIEGSFEARITGADARILASNERAPLSHVHETTGLFICPRCLVESRTLVIRETRDRARLTLEIRIDLADLGTRLTSRAASLEDRMAWLFAPDGMIVASPVPDLAREKNAVHTERIVSLGVLSANVAHEIRNPLTYVIGNLKLAILAADADPPMKKKLEAALAGGWRIDKIVADLRVFSHPGDDHLDTIDLQTLVDSAPSRNRIEISLRRRDREAIAVIRDNGPDILKAVRERLFTRFFTTKPPGVGIALLEPPRLGARRQSGDDHGSPVNW